MPDDNQLSPEVTRSLALALLGGGLGYTFNPLKHKLLSASLGSLVGYTADRALASYEKSKGSEDTPPGTSKETPDGGSPPSTTSAENEVHAPSGSVPPTGAADVPKKPASFPVGSLLSNSLMFRAVAPKAVIPGAGAAAAAGGAGTWLPPALLATQAEQAVEGALDPDSAMRDLYGARSPLEAWRWGSARNIGAALRMVAQSLDQRRASRKTDRETIWRAVQRSGRQGNLSPDLGIYR